MLAKIYTATLLGLDTKIIEVEVDYRKGNTFFSIVGLADKSIQEAKDRIPSALKNSGASFIPMQIIINLAPAEFSKSGPSYDLPIAVGYLAASEQIDYDFSKSLFIGELALDGSLRPVFGILPIIDSVKKLGFKEIYIPSENVLEASIIKGVELFPVNSLRSLILHLKGVRKIDSFSSNLKIISSPEDYRYNFKDVRGQDHTKRALEIAAAGGHNTLMSGVPGSGKTLLSRCLPSIMPEMTLDEMIEVTRIYSIAGLTSKDKPLATTRPFRSPHHTISHVALVGGGSHPKPGEITLANRGVLFLDEFSEFSNLALESLRQPLEDRIINIARANASITFPANFILVAAMNPCKCGYKGDPDRECSCSAIELSRYKRRISGPILDRIDMLIKVPKVENSKLISLTEAEESCRIRERVQIARNLQLERYKYKRIYSNAEMSQNDIQSYVKLDGASVNILNLAVNKMNLSARAYFKLLKVSRTIADLEQSSVVKQDHLVEALSYRVEVS